MVLWEGERCLFCLNQRSNKGETQAYRCLPKTPLLQPRRALYSAASAEHLIPVPVRIWHLRSRRDLTSHAEYSCRRRSFSSRSPALGDGFPVLILEIRRLTWAPIGRIGCLPRQQFITSPEELLRAGQYVRQSIINTILGGLKKESTD